MFRNSRKVLGSLACAAVLASASSNVKVEASGFPRILAAVICVVEGTRAGVEWCQWAGVARDNRAGDQQGLLGIDGTIGQFCNVTRVKGSDDSWKGLIVPIGDTVIAAVSGAAAAIG